MNRKIYIFCLLALVFAGTAVRLGLIARDFGKIDDPDNYLPFAKTLLAGEGFKLRGRPSAYRPPLYPLLLAPVVATFPNRLPLGIALLHLSLGALTILATAETVRNWSGSFAAALIAGGIVAFDPVLVSQSRPVMTETLAALLTSATLFAFSRPSSSRLLLGGLAFGVGALCRPTVWPVFALTLIAVALCEKGRSIERFRQILLIAFGCSIVVAPWLIRNEKIFGEPIFTTTHGGYTLFLANNNVYYDEVVNGPPGTVWNGPNQYRWWDSVRRETIGMPEPQADRFARNAAFRVIAERPGDFLRASVARLSRFWGVAPADAVYSRTLRLIAAVWTVPLWIALALGLTRKEVWRWPLAVAPAFLIGFSFVHTFFWTDLRMRASIVPAIAAVAPLAIRRFSIHS